MMIASHVLELTMTHKRRVLCQLDTGNGKTCIINLLARAIHYTDKDVRVMIVFKNQVLRDQAYQQFIDIEQALSSSGLP